MKKTRKLKLKDILLAVLGLLLVLSNIFWLKVYFREKEDLRNILVPSLSEDYYTQQLFLTKQTEYAENGGGTSPPSGPDYPNKYYFKHDVPLVLQNPDYPSGCEAASAVMLLNFHGVDITLKEFIDDFLPKKPVYASEGKLYGPDPSEFFAGDITSGTNGWGVFEPAIKMTISEVLREENIEKELHIAGSDKLPLSYELFDFKPIMIWTTIDYVEVPSLYTWSSYDGVETHTYPKNSHAVVITGYDEKYYYINDPLKDETNIPIERGKLEKSFDALGRQLVKII